MKKWIIPILGIAAVLGILAPALISTKLEDVVLKEEARLRQLIPNNDSLYLQIYKGNLPDSLITQYSILQARINQVESQIGQMWSMIDSAGHRRKNKGYRFLTKEGHSQHMYNRLLLVDSLLQDLSYPSSSHSLGLYPEARQADSTWQESHFQGQYYTAQTYLTQWMYKTKLAEKEVLEEGLKK